MKRDAMGIEWVCVYIYIYNYFQTSSNWRFGDMKFFFFFYGMYSMYSKMANFTGYVGREPFLLNQPLGSIESSQRAGEEQNREVVRGCDLDSDSCWQKCEPVDFVPETEIVRS